MESIIFIGLGHMGAPMATKLIESGYEVELYDSAPKVLSQFSTLKCKSTHHLSDIEFRDKIVMSMLPNDKAASQVFNDSSYLKILDPSVINISMSTLSPAMVKKLQDSHTAHGATFINCPVFGRPESARLGKLFGILSCTKELKERVEKILSSFCEKIFYFGQKPESSALVKLAANFLVISAIEAVSEACEYIDKNNLDANLFADMVTSSLFDCTVYHYHSKNIANRVYLPCGFSMGLGLKDIHLFNDVCSSLDVSLPFSKIIESRIETGIKEGRSEFDWAAIRETSYRL